MITLDNRLKTAAAFCREGKAAVDVGCDHAQLACCLAREKSCRVIASDVRDGPLEAARRTVKREGLTNVEVIKSDGLREIDSADDVIICGMGGELIAEIIGGCRFISEDTRFILQPMTKPEVLRRRLYENGFEIIEERTARDSGRLYAVMLVKYTGARRAIDDAEAFSGKVTDPAYIHKAAEKLRRQAAGMLRSEGHEKQAERLLKTAAELDEKAELLR